MLKKAGVWNELSENSKLLLEGGKLENFKLELEKQIEVILPQASNSDLGHEYHI